MKLLNNFRTEVQLDEGEVASSDFIIGKSGRRIRAHHWKVGDIARDRSGKTLIKNPVMTADFSINKFGRKSKGLLNFVSKKKAVKMGDTKSKDAAITEHFSPDPPIILMLKRQSIRLYPDGTKIALYYNDKLKQYFSVPVGLPTHQPAIVQAEEVEVELTEHVMDSLHKIVAGKSAQRVKFANGKTRKVDHFTASALVQLHGALNDQNKQKLRDTVHKSPEHFIKMANFAFSKHK